MKLIPWWWTEIGKPEKRRLDVAFRRKCFSMGALTRELEDRMAAFLGVPYAVAVPSGTAALTLALMAVGIQPGDEVIMPDLTWVATAQAAYILGAKVVLADSHPDVPVVDVAEVKKKLTRRTRAIIPVHYNGRACDMVALKSLGVPLVEDACKALGSKVGGQPLGTVGDIGCYSFGLVSLVTAGYGGLVTTWSEELHRRLRLARDHGVRRDDEAYLAPGWNFKFSDLLASIALAQLENVERRKQALLKVYRRYAEGLRDLKAVKLIPVDVPGGSLPLLIDVLSPRADELRQHLREHGVQTAPFHPPLHTAGYLGASRTGYPGFQTTPIYTLDVYPNATHLWRQGLNLPSGPGQRLDDVDRCLELIHAWERRIVGG